MPPPRPQRRPVVPSIQRTSRQDAALISSPLHQPVCANPARSRTTPPAQGPQSLRLRGRGRQLLQSARVSPVAGLSSSRSVARSTLLAHEFCTNGSRRLDAVWLTDFGRGASPRARDGATDESRFGVGRAGPSVPEVATVTAANVAEHKPFETVAVGVCQF